MSGAYENLPSECSRGGQQTIADGVKDAAELVILDHGSEAHPA
jgi:hypothetical protein